MLSEATLISRTIAGLVNRNSRETSMNAILNGNQVDHVGVVAAVRMATALILIAMAVLAITSLSSGRDRAAAQGGAEPPTATATRSDPRVSRQAGSFAFGYVEFDWDPSAPGGVPGFNSWPPASQH